MSIRAEATSLRSVEVWPPNDTEESILGTDLHQGTITNLRIGINEAAYLERTPDGGLPWHALTQMLLGGFHRRDGSSYRTYPDLFVYRHGYAPHRPSYSIPIDGPPSMIVEVLSDSTYEVDLDFENGKGFSYAEAGVPEYLVLDPMDTYGCRGGRAWRLAGGTYVPWERDERGRWMSDEIPISIGVESGTATVYSGQGKRFLREGEVEEALGRQAAEIAELRRRLEDGGTVRD